MFLGESFYLWKGKIEKTKETVMILKTQKSKFLKVKKEIKKLHPYSIPCIIKIQVDCENEYFQWLKKEIG